MQLHICASVHVSVYRFWHDRCYTTIVIQHLSNHYPIANGIYIGHFGDNTKSEWARNRRESERASKTRKKHNTHLLPCIHVRMILLQSIYCSLDVVMLFFSSFVLVALIHSHWIFVCLNITRTPFSWQSQTNVLSAHNIAFAIGNRHWKQIVNACVETYIQIQFVRVLFQSVLLSFCRTVCPFLCAHF